MPATRVTRQDTRFHAPDRSVVSITKEVFGVASVDGPFWILDPPIAIRERFWKEFGDRIDEHRDVFAAEGRVLVEALRDVHGRPIPGGEGLSGEGWLFFVDLAPPANWAHPCAYVVLRPDADSAWLTHRWPPDDTICLIPLPHRTIR
jgi:hypothetical protein